MKYNLNLPRDDSGLFIDDNSVITPCTDPIRLETRAFIKKEASRGRDEGEPFCLICGDTQREGDLIRLLRCDDNILCRDCYTIQINMIPSIQ